MQKVDIKKVQNKLKLKGMVSRLVEATGLKYPQLWRISTGISKNPTIDTYNKIVDGIVEVESGKRANRS